MRKRALQGSREQNLAFVRLAVAAAPGLRLALTVANIARLTGLTRQEVYRCMPALVGAKEPGLCKRGHPRRSPVPIESEVIEDKEDE